VTTPVLNLYETADGALDDLNPYRPNQHMHIHVLTRYGPLGSSSRVRFHQYYPYLQTQGIEIHNAALLDDEYVRRLYGKRPVALSSIALAYFRRLTQLTRARSFDLLWLEKELFPWLPALGEQYLARNGIPYIVDYDDAVFHRYDLHPNQFVRAALGRKIDAVMRHAALVVVGNDYLAERARRAGAARIARLPSVVDLNRYKPRVNHADGVFRIGWVGSPVTAPYLELIRKPLEFLCRQRNVRLILIGAGERDPLPGVAKEMLPWSDANEATILQTLDAGVMPLVDGPFERGKCGYKLIQYMAAGLPVIASPVGMNSEIVENGRTGFLASNADEWISAFEYLRDNPSKRAAMGRAGRKKAEKAYGLNAAAPKLLDLMRGVARRRA
jgi:glycosyltransferase involved in cell wall biosynthesis